MAIDEVYCLSDVTINVDVNVGLITAPDGIEHNCQYDSGVCDLGDGGLMMWDVSDTLTKLERCPWLVQSHEICIASQGTKNLDTFLTLSCESSKTRMHIAVT